VERTEGAKRQEPDQHDRAEQLADGGRAAGLDQEESDQEPERSGKNERLEQVSQPRRFAKPFDGAEHGHGRRDNAVTIKERGATHAKNRDNA
jgi:hypothetical protein